MKRRELKAKAGFSFWSSTKRRKGFSKINDSAKSSLQKCIICHPRLIQYPIVNHYITVEFDDVKRGVKTELRQKVFIQLSVRELHIDMQKNATGFSMTYDENGLIHNHSKGDS